MEPRVLSVCWIPKGKLQKKPEKVLSDENELEKLAKAADEESLDELSTTDEEISENEDVDGDNVSTADDVIQDKPSIDDVIKKEKVC